MAATGKTPILLYGSTIPTNAPTAGNLTNSSDGCEIAINVADKNLFFKDSTNAVNIVPIRQSSASSNGWLSSTDWSTFNSKQAAGSYALTTGTLAQFASTTSAQLAGVISDETGSGVLVFGTSPTISTPTLTGDVACSTGNLVIGTSGKGIDFSATPGTGTSELLADYEEGTCSLAISDGTTSSATQTFEYTKIGRVVTVKVALYAVSTSGLNASAGLRITGFPYTIGGTYGMPNTLFQPKFGGIYAEGASGATYAGLYSISTAQDGTAITVTTLGSPATMSVFGCFIYQV